MAIPERDLEERVASIAPTVWRGIVFRVAPLAAHPLTASRRAARWNRKDMRTIYTSLEPDTALTEVRFHLARQAPLVTRTHGLSRIEIDLRAVLDLRHSSNARLLELPRALMDDYDWSQRIGAAAVLLRHDGIILPSARAPGGTNVVIYFDRLHPEAPAPAVLETTPVEFDLSSGAILIQQKASDRRP